MKDTLSTILAKTTSVGAPINAIDKIKREKAINSNPITERYEVVGKSALSIKSAKKWRVENNEKSTLCGPLYNRVVHSLGGTVAVTPSKPAEHPAARSRERD